MIDPELKTAAIYTAVDECTPIQADDILTGVPVLPEFSMTLKDVLEID